MNSGMGKDHFQAWRRLQEIQNEVAMGITDQVRLREDARPTSRITETQTAIDKLEHDLVFMRGRLSAFQEVADDEARRSLPPGSLADSRLAQGSDRV